MFILELVLQYCFLTVTSAWSRYMHPIMILKFQYSNSKAYIGFSEERPYKHYM